MADKYLAVRRYRIITVICLSQVFVTRSGRAHVLPSPAAVVVGGDRKASFNNNTQFTCLSWTYMREPKDR